MRAPPRRAGPSGPSSRPGGTASARSPRRSIASSRRRAAKREKTANMARRAAGCLIAGPKGSELTGSACYGHQPLKTAPPGCGRTLGPFPGVEGGICRARLALRRRDRAEFAREERLDGAEVRRLLAHQAAQAEIPLVPAAGRQTAEPAKVSSSSARRDRQNRPTSWASCQRSPGPIPGCFGSAVRTWWSRFR